MAKMACEHALKSSVTYFYLCLTIFLLLFSRIFASSGDINPILTPQNSHSLVVRNIQCSPDGKYIASTAMDGTASLWETSSFNKLSVIGSDVFSTSFSPTGTSINLCRSNYISQFSIEKMGITDKSKLNSPTKSQVILLNDGQSAWDIKKSAFIDATAKSPSGVRDASFCEEKYLAAYSFPNKVEIWNYQTNLLIQTIKLPDYDNMRTKFNKSGDKLAVFTDRFEISLYYGDNFSQKKILQERAARNIAPITYFEFFQTLTPVYSLAFTTNDSILSLNNTNNEISLVSFSPDGNLLCSILLNSRKEYRVYFHCPSIEISPDGNLAAIWSHDNFTVNILKTSTGEKITEIKLTELSGFNNYLSISTLKFSPDNNSIYIGDKSGSIIRWDVNGSYLGKFGQEISGIFAIKYTADDTLTLVTDNLAAVSWNTVTGRAISQPGIDKKFQYPVEIMPDGSIAHIGSSIDINNIERDTKLKYDLKGWNYNPRYSLFDVKPKQIAAILREDKNDSNIAAAYLNVADGTLSINLIREVDMPPITVNALIGKGLLRGSNKKNASIVDLKTGFTDQTDIKLIQTAEITDSGEILFANTSSDRIQNNNVTSVDFGILNANGKIIWKRRVNDIGFANRIIYTKSYFGICDTSRSRVSLFKMSDGSFINKLPSIECKAISFTPDGTQLVSAESSNTVVVYQLPEGKIVRKFNIMALPTAMDFSPDGKFVAIGCSNGAVEIISRFDWSRQALAMVGSDGEWSVVDDAGRYDAPGGNARGLRWTIANESVALEQLKERYYDPGLMSKAMDKNFEPKRDVQAIDGVKLFPNMKVDFPVEGTELTIDLINQGGGIGDLMVLVNGRAMPVDARGNNDKNSKSLQTRVNVAHSPVFLPGVDNLIELAVKNADGTLTSKTLSRIWRAPGTKKENPPRLFALICGISDYAGGMKLKYAANDALSMSKAIKIGGGDFFGEDKVNIITLTSSSKDNKPTRANILKALDFFKDNATTSDLIMVYLSGHGTALNDDDYYYLTSDAHSAEGIRDKKLRDKYAISSADLQLLMGRIPALKQLLILDTCAAGSAAANMITNRDINGNQMRAIERLRDRSGFHILMGCAADAKSFEASRYGHGLLTYALLEGLKGAALRDGTYIDTSKLFNYAANRVPQLARGIGGIQKPIIAVPHGISFDFGMLNDKSKALIDIATPLPVYVKSAFFDAQKTRDTLNIAENLHNALHEKSDKLICVEADNFPDGYKINGIYTINDDIITAKIKIWQNEKVVNEFTIQAKKADEIVKQIVSKL